MSRVLFCLHSPAQFEAHRTTIEALLGQGVRVRLYFNPRWSCRDAGLSEPLNAWARANPDAPVAEFPVRQDRWRAPLRLARDLRSYRSLCRQRPDASPYLERWLQSLGVGPERTRQLAGPSALLLGRSIGPELAARAIQGLAPVSAELVDWLRRKKPAAVVIAPGGAAGGEEAELARAARSLGIRTVLAAESWDGLAHKGLIGEAPDLMLVWNQAQAEQARVRHGMAAERIRVAGAPLFDRWRVPEPAASHAEACARAGLDPARPYLIYLGSSRLIAPDEDWLLHKLRTALDASEDDGARALQILFRPHPAGPPPPSVSGVAVLDPQAAATDLESLLRNASSVIAVNTRGLLDAVAADRPVIALQPEIFAGRLARVHGLDAMIEHGAVFCATTPSKAAARATAHLYKDSARKQRRAFARTFLGPPSGASAGQAQARAILQLIGRKWRSTPSRPAMPEEPESAPIVANVSAELAVLARAARARLRARRAEPDLKAAS
jgi:hypothetical protein